MQTMIDVRQARYVRDYVLHLEFDDGLEGDVDLAPYLQRGPIFTPLASPSYFRRFTLEGGTVAWPNGADIAPERLYPILGVASGTLVIGIGLWLLYGRFRALAIEPTHVTSGPAEQAPAQQPAPRTGQMLDRPHRLPLRRGQALRSQYLLGRLPHPRPRPLMGRPAAG